MSLLIVRLMVILGITAFHDVSALTDTLIDSIAIVIYIAFIILGIRMKKSSYIENVLLHNFNRDIICSNQYLPKKAVMRKSNWTVSFTESPSVLKGGKESTNENGL